MIQAGKLKWWQLAGIAVVASFLGGLSSGIRNKEEREVYELEFRQAPWAPPGWLFAPAWTINNFFLLKALQKILSGNNTTSSKSLLKMQAAIWVIFFSFGYVYFKKQSPILAAVWTIADAALAIASILKSYKRDKQLAGNYLPLATWTTFASTIAVYQWLKNPDPLFQTKALLD